ncbi:MAG: prephenate dehydratase domain-containing protein [Thermoanaerobaculia bacterium]
MPELALPTRLRRRHCLAAHPGAVLKDLSRILSHPQALAQCTTFLSDLPEAEKVAFEDTAAARAVAENSDKTAGAIASKKLRT